MYRAVMEEVVRFLEKCHRSLDTIHNEPISRSKSVHHVEKGDIDYTNNLRARSSINLIDYSRVSTQPDSINGLSSNEIYDNLSW